MHSILFAQIIEKHKNCYLMLLLALNIALHKNPLSFGDFSCNCWLVFVRALKFIYIYIFFFVRNYSFSAIGLKTVVKTRQKPYCFKFAILIYLFVFKFYLLLTNLYWLLNNLTLVLFAIRFSNYFENFIWELFNNIIDFYALKEI